MQVGPRGVSLFLSTRVEPISTCGLHRDHRSYFNRCTGPGSDCLHGLLPLRGAVWELSTPTLHLTNYRQHAPLGVRCTVCDFRGPFKRSCKSFRIQSQLTRAVSRVCQHTTSTAESTSALSFYERSSIRAIKSFSPQPSNVELE